MTPSNAAAAAWLLQPSTRPRPRPIVRAPLPAFPPGAYARDLPWTPPVSRDFIRADSWGITLPGAPWVPGASSRHPERILSWFLDRYPPAFQARYLAQVNLDGYTHVKQSAADSMGPIDNGPNHPPGNAQTLAQFVQTCLRITAAGLYVQVVLGSKDFQPRDMSADQWIAYADPIMDALISAHAVDEFIPGWEWDLWNVPGGTTLAVWKHVGQKAHAAGCSCWGHFSPEHTSWFADGDPAGRFGFWRTLGADVDGLDYQTDPTWTVEELQARLVDTLWQFGLEGNVHKLRMDEDEAALEFDSDTVTEDLANLRGYLACCTVDNVRHTDARIWGFGNGGRLPDGRPL